MTPDGLKQLTVSRYVRGLFREPNNDLRSAAFDADNQLGKIEDAIAINGYADIEVDLNLENFDFDISADGKSIGKKSALQELELRNSLPGFHDSLPASGILNLSQRKADVEKLATQGATQTLRVNTEGLYALAEHEKIRAIRLAGTDLRKKPSYDLDVLSEATRNGYADVIINLQPAAGYTPKEGLIPAAAWKAQTATLRKTMVDVLSKFDTNAIKSAQEFEGLGAAFVRLNAAAVMQMFKNPDPRIWQVRLNKPAAFPALAQSTVLMNMPQVWNNGYTAVGQTIAVLDTGVEKTHPFLQTLSGQPKVVYEACFGTTIQNTTITSMCPNADSNGDSPLGLSNSATPCTDSSAYLCFHGTHVSGIAAGKRSWNGLTGVAPDANIIAIKVFSLDTNTAPRPEERLSAYDADMIAGLKALDQSGLTEVTVNFSLSGGAYSASEDGSQSSCDKKAPEFTKAVSNLKSKNVAVIAATGNDANWTGIGWPACVSNVIKVVATDDTMGVWVSFNNGKSSNLGNPANYSGPFYVAPGSMITSAGLNGTQRSEQGTSMAAPHVAGLYAVLKAAVPGVSWLDTTNWMTANAIPFNNAPIYPSGTFKRVYVPTL